MSEMTDLGPHNEEERLIFAIEELRLSVQFAIQEAMVEKGVSRSELARRMNLSAARITQILSEDANPRLETIAKIVFHLDAEVSFSRTQTGKRKKAKPAGAIYWENQPIAKLQSEVKERAKKHRDEDVHLIEQIKSCIVKSSKIDHPRHSNENMGHLNFVRRAA